MISTDLSSKNSLFQIITVKKKSIFDKEITDTDFLHTSHLVCHINLEEQSHLKLTIMLHQVQDITIELKINAQGASSLFEVVFLYALSSNQKIKVVTKQLHTGKKTESKFFARGIVKDTALVDHQGLIFIDEHGAQTQALLEHKAIVFGSKARVILVPSIEVLNHDVGCAHGAAVGQFQEEHVWYLMSRGFNEKQAHQILIQSFFAEFVQNFKEPEKVLERLCQKIL
jgi:Fe-S cluster assembly scaffold protein SufB